MTRESIGEQQARLEEQIKSVVTSLTMLTEQGKEAAESRRRGYQAQEELRYEVPGIKHRLAGLEKSVDAIKPTTAEYAQVRDRVVFAGSMGAGSGRSVGKSLLSAAAGAAAAWYAITGRPPP